MERQRSFAFKHTRFLVISFTISSFFVFLTFISLWFVKNYPSLPESYLLFNKTPIAVSYFKPINLETIHGFRKNFSESDKVLTHLVDTHLKKHENVSGFARISVINGKNETLIKKIQEVPITNISESIVKKAGKFEAPDIVVRKQVNLCDLTKGKWVLDDESDSLYSNSSCPFIDEGFDCEGNGRLDLHYKKFKWLPQDCDIYRFNATKMLELIRGKRLVFVGDSINRNQWESMLCMLFAAIRDPKKVYETRGRRITKKKGNYSFRFVDYKCTVEYYVTHFIVHEDKARVGRKRVQTLRIDTIDRGSSRWRGADILVFNSAHWWSHYKTKSGINYYQEKDQVHPQLDVNTAFRKAMMTWASWVDKYINPKKTRVFFRNSAPSHFRGGQWNSGGHCKETTRPLNRTFSSNYPEKNRIVEDVINEMKTPVTLLNITGLSDYRIDGHPSIYGKSLENRQSSKVEDCSHWCLPGVPDTWNELLYFHLKYKERVK